MDVEYRNSADIRDLQALEGKDVKDLLLNVGSGGGAAAPAAGGAAASGDAPAAEEKAEEKEEGTSRSTFHDNLDYKFTDKFYSKGGVRRGYGLRSFRLNFLKRLSCLYLQMHGHGLLALGATFGWLSSFS
jgi:hypothetical protein